MKRAQWAQYSHRHVRSAHSSQALRSARARAMKMQSVLPAPPAAQARSCSKRVQTQRTLSANNAHPTHGALQGWQMHARKTH
eukprot:3554096-Rhodomonas_salina.1